jgi:mRNA interferase MazF
MTPQLPSRGEIWLVDLNPTRGHEQSGVRPALVVSVDTFNHGPAGLAVVLPVTSRGKGIALHVSVDPPEAGLTTRSFIKAAEEVALARGNKALRELLADRSRESGRYSLEQVREKLGLRPL